MLLPPYGYDQARAGLLFDVDVSDTAPCAAHAKLADSPPGQDSQKNTTFPGRISWSLDLPIRSADHCQCAPAAPHAIGSQPLPLRSNQGGLTCGFVGRYPWGVHP